MPPPPLNTPVTSEQVQETINLADFPGAEPGPRGWHDGLFEPWAMNFGYPDGMPVYGSVQVDGSVLHIYFLNDQHQLPIILRQGQTPQDYGVTPEN